MNQDVATSPRQRRKQARPAELLAAALDHFVERGFAATKLDDVAAQAGVSKGTLYLYFDSKEELFKAVIRQGIFPVLDQGEAMLVQHDGDARSLLQGLLLRWWELVGATPLGGISKLMISEAGNFPDVAQYYYEHVIVRGRNLLRQALERGIAAGEFRAVDIESAIDVIFAPVMMLTIWRYSLAPCGCGRQDPETYLRTHLDLLLNGLEKKQ
ncbi:TetR family transcriptional regulator [Ferrigenium kumadai]|uniref:TetR family transcriptional regulator n=1 Tax=Ferrigenium kumadai TaxID=1682490 RepID=A0AAN1VZ14_9PROT|nr:TetR/AcrR family transcriptional regulator [Ferrigenium kumadai]BBI98823.1 TetR family transcriptional regulator [Ferrigenium kumadai]